MTAHTDPLNNAITLVRLDRQRQPDERHPRHRHPPLDLMYIRGAMVEAGFGPPRLIDDWLGERPLTELIEDILRHRPKVVVVRAMSWCLSRACQLGETLRAQGVITLAVGEQVTHRARQPEIAPAWDRAWDIPVLGEPEEQVPALLTGLLGGQPQERLAAPCWARLDAVRPFLVEKPDRLPAPPFTAAELDAYPFPFPVPGPVIRRWGYLISGRGCPYHCQHCTEVVRKSVGTRLRLREPVSVVDEMEALVRQGAEGIVFEDDTLFCSRHHLLALCREIERRQLRVRWIANARPDELDPERVQAAARAGAVLLKVGIESGSAQMIEAIGKSRCGQRWLEQARAGIRCLQAEGIASVGLFMIGMPGETEAQAQQTLALARRLGNEYVQVQRFTPYADVALTQGSGAADLYHYAAPESTLSAIPSAQLVQLHRLFYRRLYLRPAYVRRHLRLFWRWYLHPRFLAALPGRLAYLLGLKLSRVRQEAPCKR